MKIVTDEDRLMWLDALEAAGVDNWDGFDEARAIYKEWLLAEEQEREDAEQENE